MPNKTPLDEQAFTPKSTLFETVSKPTEFGGRNKPDYEHGKSYIFDATSQTFDPIEVGPDRDPLIKLDELEWFVGCFFDKLAVLDPIQVAPPRREVVQALAVTIIGLIDHRLAPISQPVVHNHQHYHPSRGHVVKVVGQTAIMEPSELATAREEVAAGAGK
jgi:hypothetical protein